MGTSVHIYTHTRTHKEDSCSYTNPIVPSDKSKCFPGKTFCNIT